MVGSLLALAAGLGLIAVAFKAETFERVMGEGLNRQWRRWPAQSARISFDRYLARSRAVWIGCAMVFVVVGVFGIAANL